MKQNNKDLVNKVKQYIRQHNLIEENDTVIVGLSGGADSVCLLRLLAECKEQLKVHIVCVHVHHGIRGKDADDDERFVRKLCEKRDVELYVYKKNIPEICRKTHESEEECGRRIRYEIFSDLSGKLGNAKIAVAHHMNDQAETIIFRMLRGTGIKGIAGMQCRNGNIIRPLLTVCRKEIIDYLSDIEQDFREDYTNNDTSYSRNYIRKELISGMERINKGAVEHIVSLGSEAADVQEYMEAQAENILNKAIESRSDSDIRVNVEEIVNEVPIMRTYVIRQLLRMKGISLKDVSREHIDDIDALLFGHHFRSVDLPRKVTVVREGRYLFVEDRNIESDFDKNRIFESLSQLSEEYYSICTNAGTVKCRLLNDFDIGHIPDTTYTKWFDYDKISNGLCIRNRKEGDYLIVNEQGNSKKLKDYMINEKIPKSKRDEIPILANGNKVVWVLGYRISADAKVTEATKTVLEVMYELN